jgi:plasmid replication initiation protein
MINEFSSRKDLRVVTSNDFIFNKDVARLSLNAKKLLYIAIAQCRMQDGEFYTYEITPKELAKIMDVSVKRIYQCIDDITDELMKTIIKKEDGIKWRKKNLFSECSYTYEKLIEFKIDSSMKEFFLEQKRNFAQPLLYEFMNMHSSYSIAVWHLLQIAAKNKYITNTTTIRITLEDLRKVTGTENILKQLVHFKTKVLKQAIKDIEKVCCIKIEYKNVKKGRSVYAFDFTFKSIYEPKKISKELKNKIERAENFRKNKIINGIE